MSPSNRKRSSQQSKELGGGGRERDTEESRPFFSETPILSGHPVGDCVYVCA